MSPSVLYNGYQGPMVVTGGTPVVSAGNVVNPSAVANPVNVGPTIPDGNVAQGGIPVYNLPAYQPGTPFRGVRSEPQNQVLEFDIVEANVELAKGESKVYDLGPVMEIMDGSESLSLGKFRLTTPDGLSVDLYYVTRLRSDPRTMPSLPPGKYTITNLGDAAATPNVAFYTATPRD